MFPITTGSTASKSSSIANVHEFTDRNFESLLKRLPTYSHLPVYLLKELEQSKSSDDLKQIDVENHAFDSFKKLELLYSLYQSDRNAFKDTFFLDTNVVKNIFDSTQAHVYMKYYRYLFDNFSIDLIQFFTDNLVERLKAEKVIRLGFYSSLDELIGKLLWTQIRNDKFESANELLTEYLKYLDFLDTYLTRINSENNSVNKDVDNKRSKNILLASKFFALAHMVIVKNNLYNFKDTLDTFNKAVDVMKQCSESR